MESGMANAPLPPALLLRESLDQAVGRNITRVRERHGFSVAELAGSANITESKLLEYECGSHSIASDELINIAEACNATINDMFLSADGGDHTGRQTPAARVVHGDHPTTPDP
jgi:transcriptional regulator with XRE-family HTH domain